LAEIASYDDAVAWLDDHIGAGVKPGLERITGLLELLARPDESYPIVHVAGTNGKTSTARMTAGLIGAHGLATGLFTSPHLQAVEERYEHGLRPMSPEAFATATAELAPFVDLWSERSGDRITYFEITAALAFAWFAEKAVDAAVIETLPPRRWRWSPPSVSSTPPTSGTPRRSSPPRRPPSSTRAPRSSPGSCRTRRSP
jgi:dihydrofolate synthase/folylpolyglutamate synthase